MSINITLHSNSNNNQDNKMLNHIDYIKKKELERRKLLRIEQVRFYLKQCRCQKSGNILL